jgi:hypothetical protein
MTNFLLGSTNSSSSDTSDHEDNMPLESISQLNTSLKLAQARAASLSTNFARLMRLVLDEELDAIDREITQVKKGNSKALESIFKEAESEWEAKKRIGRSRLIRASDEIDIRFGATVSAEWTKFRVISPSGSAR